MLVKKNIEEARSSAPEIASQVAAYNYFDISGAINIAKTVTIRLGINNLFDKDPPIMVSGTFSDCPVTFCNGNTYSQFYDALGRYVYGHVTVQF